MIGRKKNSSGIGILSLLLVIGWCGYAVYRISTNEQVVSEVERTTPPVHLTSKTPVIRDEMKRTDDHTIISQLQMTEPIKEPETKFEMKIAEKAIPTSQSGEELHVIFSTDCGTFQDWQTLLVFHSAKAVHQKGTLTRIASGCDAEREVELTELYKKLYPDYHVHFTPDFKTDAKTGRKYDFYNKPYGVLHWLDHANPAITPGTIVALIDPDFIFLRPLTTQMSGQANTIVTGPVKPSDVFDKITKGRPVAQQYGLGAPWVNDDHKKFNRTKICGSGSPCLRVANDNIGRKYFSVGPPYILEKEDFHRLTRSWTTLVPRVYEGYPHLLAEMYAYSMAAAHEDLPHLSVDHFMVSNVQAGGEGWQWIDALGDDICQPPIDGIFYPAKPLPTFLHYCQSYHGPSLNFQKRAIPHDIFTCQSTTFPEPSQKSALRSFGNADTVTRSPSLVLDSVRKRFGSLIEEMPLRCVRLIER
jgi:peptidyl serine alpha-galactosyltransferase